MTFNFVLCRNESVDQEGNGGDNRAEGGQGWPGRGGQSQSGESGHRGAETPQVPRPVPQHSQGTLSVEYRPIGHNP